MTPRVNGLSIVGLVMTFVFLGSLLPGLFQRSDLWWTPRQLALGLEEGRGRVRILVEGTPVEEQLANGTLGLRDDEGNWQAVAPDDVRLRLNNWHRVHASRLSRALIEVAGATAGILFLIFGTLVLPAVARRGAPPRADASPETHP